jgi:hypothetical protein
MLEKKGDGTSKRLQVRTLERRENGRTSTGKLLAEALQNGNLWYTPGSFRKSGKQRTYAILSFGEFAAH